MNERLHCKRSFSERLDSSGVLSHVYHGKIRNLLKVARGRDFAFASHENPSQMAGDTLFSNPLVILQKILEFLRVHGAYELSKLVDVPVLKVVLLFVENVHHFQQLMFCWSLRKF